MPIRPLRRLKWLPLAALGLAGCAHQPAKSPAPDATLTTPTIATYRIEPAQAATSTGTDLANTPPATAAEAPSEAASAILTTPAPQAAVPPGDLFDRLRRGFKLEDVDETAIDRELNWYANNPEYLERVWGRAELYMHYIVEQLEARGMPRELALLPVVESAFEPYAYSRARASGLWQFIPGTGSKYGLKQNWWYDGRRDVVESTRAALDYLQELHDEFSGDWLLAIAAYNCGEGAVARAVASNQRLGKPADFWHLKLPKETRAYVPKLLAMRRLMLNPGDFGLEFSPIPDQQYFTQVATGGQADLGVVAELAGITKDEIYELNPAFHRWATDPSGPYALLMPLEASEGLEQTLLSLTPEQRMRVERYEVARGDTVASIAKRYATTTSVLRELNGMSESDPLAVGSELRVPSSSVQLPAKAARAAMLVDRRFTPTRRGVRPVVHVVRRGDTLSAIARSIGTDMKTLARLNNMQVNDTLRAGQRLVVSAQATNDKRSNARQAASDGNGRKVTYTVRAGDTLYSIARLLQVTVSELLGWNDMRKSSIIKPGQKLVAFVDGRG